MLAVFDRVRMLTFFMATLVVGALGMLAGCGVQDPDAPKGPPVPETRRDYSGPGTPIRFLGAGGQRFRPGADDPEYQEYLLWKEWKEYQRYLEFVKSQEENSAAGESDSQ